MDRHIEVVSLTGIWAPRVSEDNGQALSSPRLISSTIFEDEDRPNQDYTLLLMQYGQFFAHEVSQSFDASYGKLLLNKNYFSPLHL